MSTEINGLPVFNRGFIAQQNEPNTHIVKRSCTKKPG